MMPDSKRANLESASQIQTTETTSRLTNVQSMYLITQSRLIYVTAFRPPYFQWTGSSLGSSYIRQTPYFRQSPQIWQTPPYFRQTAPYFRQTTSYSRQTTSYIWQTTPTFGKRPPTFGKQSPTFGNQPTKTKVTKSRLAVSL